MKTNTVQVTECVIYELITVFDQLNLQKRNQKNQRDL